MKKVDLIIHAGHMYALDGDGLGYRQGYSLAIDSGRILAVAPRGEISEAYTAEEVIDEPMKLALPGFIDAHMHTSHCVYRGVAQDIANWMMEGLAPFAQATSQAAHDAGSRLAIAEAVLGGTTTIGDYGQHMDEVARFIAKIGVRGNLIVRVRDAVERIYAQGELYEFSESLAEETLTEFCDLYNTYDGYDNGRIRVLPGPQGADFMSPQTLTRVRDIAREKGIKMHMHLSQGSRETAQMIARYGKRTIPYLRELNYLDDSLVGIHLTDATDEEAALAARHGVSMVLCSAAIGIIDGIVPPARAFQAAGGLVALGSDQAPGNNAHSILNEMRMTALFNKIAAGDPEVTPAWKVLRMATIEGARALGIDKRTGSLEAGKDADVILIDLSHISMSPVIMKPMRNLAPNLVYSADRAAVDTVIAAGNILVRHREPMKFDLEAIKAEAQSFSDSIGEAASETFWAIGGKNAIYMKEDKL